MKDFKRAIVFWKQAPVNHTIILLNILVFILVELTGSWEDTSHMLRWGAAGTWDIAEKHEYYRLFTAMFLHFGIQHLGNNMLVLLFCGRLPGEKSGQSKIWAPLSFRWGRSKSDVSFSGDLF